MPSKLFKLLREKSVFTIRRFPWLGVIVVYSFTPCFNQLSGLCMFAIMLLLNRPLQFFGGKPLLENLFKETKPSIFKI